MFNPISAIDPYEASDQDAASNPSYYGFVDVDGNWYIISINSATGATRYAKGLAGTYETSWAARTTLTYNYYYNAF